MSSYGPFRVTFDAPFDGFEHVHLKIARAQEHLNTLESEIEVFRKANDKPPVIEDYQDSGQKCAYIRGPKMPTSLGVVAAEYLTGLRSSLDYLAWQLAKLRTPTPSERTEFPIRREACKDFASFRKKEGKTVGDIALDAVRIIESLQPYKRGDAWEDSILWRLHKLSNIAKHRTMPSWGTQREITLSCPKSLEVQILDTGYMVFLGPADHLDKAEFKPASPLKVVFGEYPHGIQATFDDLREMHEFVRDDVVPRFAGFFSKTERA